MKKSVLKTLIMVTNCHNTVTKAEFIEKTNITVLLKSNRMNRAIGSLSSKEWTGTLMSSQCFNVCHLYRGYRNMNGEGTKNLEKANYR